MNDEKKSLEVVEKFLKEKFQSYYSQNFVQHPSSIGKREFGFGVFGRKIAFRHYSFRNLQDFNNYLRNEVPLFASYSLAYYNLPSAKPMHAKQFLGADLVFEFDADDFKTDCSAGHTVWECSNCKNSGKGNVHYCTACGERTVIKEWVCPECLKEVKEHALRLLEFLQDDFSLTEGLSINYSGSKGFHIHVQSEKVFSLSQNARIELLDYLTGFNLDFQSIGFSNLQDCPIQSKAFGWSKHLLQALTGFFSKTSVEELHSLAGLRSNEARQLLDKKMEVVEGILKGRLPAVGSKARSEKFWKNLLEFLKDEIALKIDRQTSVDISKIIRVPETLHGGTGLKAKEFPFASLKDFNALNETIVFSSNPVKVLVEKAPKFYLSGEWFGPFEKQVVELPEFAAVCLLAKQAAKLAAES